MKFFTNMLESWWFKRRFDSKCKLNINSLMMRIEMIKRKRKSMLNYSRSVIAELLRHELDYEAYGRIGQSYLEQNRLLCYDFVERFCIVISNHLVAMNEQSECPEECKEPVASLIYAAARFGDLPELRELRSLFSERYKDSLESFVNKEFVNLLEPERPTKDTKTRLMQDIAFEYGVEWNPKSLEQNLFKLPSSNDNRSQNGFGNPDDEYRLTNQENGWSINIQETLNEDVNDHKKDESNDDIEKQTENLRQRLLDFWSRTTSLISTSRETTTSPEDSSSSSDESTKSKPFFGFKFTKDSNSNKTRTTSNTFSNSFSNKRKRVRSSSTECLPNVERKRHSRRGVSNQPDLVVSPPTRHVHPKLPDYDDIKARFAALRAKS